MSCGSGRVLADLVSGRVPEIDARPLGLDRYTASAALAQPIKEMPA